MIMKYEISSTKVFGKWFGGLKDSAVKRKILARLSRIECGNFGDYKVISSDVNELRFFFGAGLRIYYTIQQGRIVLLLVGGDKSTQSKDIDRAIQIQKELDVDYDD